MRKETITYKIYKFDELKAKVKEKVIEKFRNNNEYYFLKEDIKERAKEMLKEHKINIIKDFQVFYSLSNCQGDGLCFIGSFRWKNYNINIEHIGNHNHSNSTNIIIETKNYNDAKQKVYDEFNEIYQLICQELEKFGYDWIDAEDSEENIKDNIEANEYEFLEDGKRWWFKWRNG